MNSYSKNLNILVRSSKIQSISYHYLKSDIIKDPMQDCYRYFMTDNSRKRES